MDSPDIRKTELLSEFGLQPRDLRVSALSSLFVRQSSIILKLQVHHPYLLALVALVKCVFVCAFTCSCSLLQHIKAIINADSVVLMDADHPDVVEFIPELQVQNWPRN